MHAVYAPYHGCQPDSGKKSANDAKCANSGSDGRQPDEHGWIVEWVRENAPKALETIAADDAFAAALATLQAKRLEAASANDAAALVTLLPSL